VVIIIAPDPHGEHSGGHGGQHCTVTGGQHGAAATGGQHGTAAAGGQQGATGGQHGSLWLNGLRQPANGFLNHECEHGLARHELVAHGLGAHGLAVYGLEHKLPWWWPVQPLTPNISITETERISSFRMAETSWRGHISPGGEMVGQANIHHPQ